MHDTEKLLRKLIVATALLASAALWWPVPASAMRLKVIAGVQGIRGHQPVGSGRVFALGGTGERSPSTPFNAQRINALPR